MSCPIGCCFKHRCKEPYKGLVTRAMQDAPIVELSPLALRGLQNYINMGHVPPKPPTPPKDREIQSGFTPNVPPHRLDDSVFKRSTSARIVGAYILLGLIVIELLILILI